MTDVTGDGLRALRRSRGWDVKDLAAEFRKISPRPLPATFEQNIRAWELGRQKPSERYWLMYTRIFPEITRTNGVLSDADVEAMVADLELRTARLPTAEYIAALEAAAFGKFSATRTAEIRAMARSALYHLGQLTDRLQQIADAMGDEEQA